MTEYDAQPGRTPPAPQLTAGQLHADDLDLTAGLAGVAGIVAGARGLSEMLCEIAEFAVRAIPGADGAGVTVVRPDQDAPHAETWSATADFVREIDSLQFGALGEGPCLTCMRSGRPTVSGSLGADTRWPRFGGRVARMDVHSVLALPLTVDGRMTGAITAYARTRDAFAEHAVQLGTQFAGPAAVAVYNARLLDRARERTEQLRRALDSRAVIDQAIGIIRSRSGEDAEQAFDRLTRISQAENTKLSAVAERLVQEAVRRARAGRSAG